MAGQQRKKDCLGGLPGWDWEEKGLATRHRRRMTAVNLAGLPSR